MTSSRSCSEAVLHDAMIYRSRCKPGDLLQHQWIMPKHQHCGYIYLLQQQSEPTQSMQRVAIYQDSTQLPSELYVSYKIFEQIIYNNQQPTTNNNNNNSSFTPFPASKSTS